MSISVSSYSNLTIDQAFTVNTTTSVETNSDQEETSTTVSEDSAEISEEAYALMESETEDSEAEIGETEETEASASDGQAGQHGFFFGRIYSKRTGNKIVRKNFIWISNENFP
ncbi:hypothetical protein [Desulfospira joergensenii]|uniref:hypothetical protein n=1 Tax=Desulfospira joergensenii TaxID=53329 RepID=UPI0003B2F7D1|nr:hypothetical protein [Desulfospira joergensenii]